MNRNISLFFTSLLLIISMQVSAEWWNESWEFQKQLDVDISGLGEGGGSASFPVLVKLSGGNFQYFMDALPKGEDLRFVAADQQTALKYHVEKFDPIAEIALIWVQVPKSAHAVTAAGVATETIYMYYGNAKAVSGAEGTATYDVNQTLIYHFDTPTEPVDVTAYQNNPSAYTATMETAGIIGSAARFVPDSILQLPVSPSLQYQAAQGYSASLWLKVNDVGTTAHLLSMAGTSSLKLSVDKGALLVKLHAGDTIIGEEKKEGALQSGSWHLLGFDVGKEQTSIYLDGKLTATLPGIVNDMSSTIAIGASVDQSGFSGMIDELQVSNISRGGAWFNRGYNNQAMGSDIIVFGGDESVETESKETESYFVTILSDVSLDGRIVIFLLGLMAASSMVVVVGKVIMLLRVNKDNKHFLKEFKGISDNLTAIDREETDEERELHGSPFLNAVFGNHDHYQSSNLYHLYHVAMGELKTRVVDGKNTSLSSQNIAAAKATLDAAFVREQQVLNKSMVLLTIAISGGPFLGLLGTVLGVMITFAAIASSGEVDINAIAPGVAAALMTTVAGLIVAIPALFAYNYLSTRIRDVTIDMRVFVDELVARIAEYHS